MSQHDLSFVAQFLHDNFTQVFDRQFGHSSNQIYKIHFKINMLIIAHCTIICYIVAFLFYSSL